jgi:hypothetical protein
MATSPYTPEQEELLAHFQENARAVAERVKCDPGGRFAAFREAQAEAERLGSYEPVARFTQRLKAGEFGRRLSCLK